MTSNIDDNPSPAPARDVDVGRLDVPVPAQHQRDRQRRGDCVRRAVHVGGELMMTAGALVVLFIVYQVWVTGLFQARTQERLRDHLARSWSAVPLGPTEAGTSGAAATGVPATGVPATAVPATGVPATGVPATGVPATGVPATAAPAARPERRGALAVLHVPAFGADYAPVVVEGVSPEDLELGPGHHPGTALPGEVGNFVVSGHRTTYGAPFARLDELDPGAPVVVEVKDTYFTYRVTRSEVVSPDRGDLILPVPSQPGAAPTRALLTFTTCHPKFSAASRLVVFAELSATRPKRDGRPPELAGG